MRAKADMHRKAGSGAVIQFANYGLLPGMQEYAAVMD